MKNNLDTPEIRQLFQAIALLDNEDDAHMFLEDICTVNELQTIAQRFEVGIQLLNGSTYQEVSRNTGASTATISRVRRLLNDDKDGLEKTADLIGRMPVKE